MTRLQRHYDPLKRLFRLLSLLCENWWLILAIFLIASPVGPHLRWDFGHTGYYGCVYLGSRGFVPANDLTHCPLLALIDARGRK